MTLSKLNSVASAHGWFNDERRLSRIVYIESAEAEKNDHRQLSCLELKAVALQMTRLPRI